MWPLFTSIISAALRYMEKISFTLSTPLKLRGCCMNLIKISHIDWPAIQSVDSLQQEENCDILGQQLLLLMF